MKVVKQCFGTINDHAINKFCLINDNGMEVHVINYGAIIQAVYLPDPQGGKTNVVLGFDNLEDYQKDQGYLGAIVGRCANRIKHGHISLGGKDYQLNRNHSGHHLHGGLEGFNRKVWNAQAWHDKSVAYVTLNYHSPDGEEHYPGNLNVAVTYCLTNENKLKIQYHATTDKATVVNLTQHSYFNLKGEGCCLGHQLKINASHFLATDEHSIPLPDGITHVKDTPMDFRQTKPIGQDIHAGDTQLMQAKGFDQCWLIDHQPDDQLTLAASVLAENGHCLDVYTDQPGLQFYAGNYLEECTQGIFADRAGFALESQQLPNAANHPEFPSPVITPEKPYQHTKEWHFYQQ